jgi:rSAM/selenodomain-associated transferase 2
MRVSVVIPVLNEADGITQMLMQLRQAGVWQSIVVDGGSSDDTASLARLYADEIMTSPRGRARQMNAGAHVADGEVLLFLHADTDLPRGFLRLISDALSDLKVVGGRFDVRLDAEGWSFRMIETLMNVRSRMTKISTGDQAIFVRRAVFQKMGGYPELELMEDIEFSRRLKWEGRIACLRERVTTSARRWQRDGVARTIVKMWTLRLCHFFGVSTARLRTYYADTR